VPAVLAPVVEPDVSLSQVEAGWDQLIRVAASIEGGWTSAVLALTRFGRPRGPIPFIKPGVPWQAVADIVLCDFMSNEVFRREVLRILNTVSRSIRCNGRFTLAALLQPEVGDERNWWRSLGL